MDGTDPNAEAASKTKMHCVKLLKQRLMALDFDRQIVELHVRIALRRLTSLSQKPWKRLARGKGNPDHQPICACMDAQVGASGF